MERPGLVDTAPLAWRPGLVDARLGDPAARSRCADADGRVYLDEWLVQLASAADNAVIGAAPTIVVAS